MAHALLLLTFTLATAATHNSNVSTQPHIVYMLCDNLGHGNVGYYRKESPAGPTLDVVTPTLDSLAATGIILDRLYTYKFCSPSRCSLMSGRLPIHVNIHNSDQTEVGAGIPEDFVTMPKLLSEVGYHSHHIGKWHIGFSTPKKTPLGRGFKSSLGYLFAYNGYVHGWAEDGCPQYPGTVEYDNHTVPGTNIRCTNGSVVARHLSHVTDLWLTENGREGPAYDINNTYGGDGFEEEYFWKRAVGLIRNHSKTTPNEPFFLYYAMHLLHSPLCVPFELLAAFDFIENEDARFVAAQTAYMDFAVKQVTDALKETSMWDKTLFVWSSDNGAAIEQVTGAKSAYPLKGGYYTNWEGGIRAPAVVNGGFLPPQRPTRVTGLMALCDWMATFCEIAGCFAVEPNSNLPKIDSISMWPVLSGKNITSPRVEIPLTPLENIDKRGGVDAGIIRGHYKLIVNNITQSSWCGVKYPNDSVSWDTWDTVEQCTTDTKIGCLFNIYEDPTEHNDLASEHPVLALKMFARLVELQATVFDPERGPNDKNNSCEQVVRNRGFWGPWLNLSTVFT